MNQLYFARLAAVCVLTVAFTLPTLVTRQEASPDATPTPEVDVIANELTNPRGFTWGPEGALYLALAGSGGSTQVGSTSFRGGETSSIVTVSNGCTTPVAEGFPSTHWPERLWVWGVMDVAFLDGELYALHSGGQQGWGLPGTPNGIYRVLDDGSWELVADLASWFKDNPVANPPDDFDPNGSLFDMEAGGDRLWITESNAGRLLTVTPDGTIELVADLSDQERTPTGLALDGEGGAYVAFLTVIPYEDGASRIVHVAADGSVTDHWTGLTAVNDLAVGPDGELYAAEMATNNLSDEPYLNPGSGRVVRRTGLDSLAAVATDVPYPVMLGFGEDGDLYVAGPAFAEDRGRGRGWIARVDVADTPVSLANIDTQRPACE